MDTNFSIYKNPLSSETLALRRNALLAASLCFFIGSTNELPKSFALFGINFNPAQQSSLGWFIFCVTLYFFIHFLASALVEVAAWIKPFLEVILTKKILLEHPAFDETSFLDIHEPPDDNDLSSVYDAAESQARCLTEKRLRHLHCFIYLKLLLEIVLPIIIGIVGLFKLGCLLKN